MTGKSETLDRVSGQNNEESQHLVKTVITDSSHESTLSVREPSVQEIEYSIVKSVNTDSSPIGSLLVHGKSALKVSGFTVMNVIGDLFQESGLNEHVNLLGQTFPNSTSNKTFPNSTANHTFPNSTANQTFPNST